MTIRRLNYQHLLYFWSVVRTGSLRQACEELALSPPTISAQLRTLEERLGEKLLAKSGRRLVPTEIGRLVYSYADEIFGLGQDLVEALAHRPTARPLRLVIGVDDVVPKEIAYRVLKPILGLEQPVRIVCREGTLERLVADLAVHEIDVVLSDAPITPSLNVRAYSHSLGGCEALWMATPTLAKRLRPGFPRSLDGAPVLLPTDDTAIRRSLEQWLEKQDVRPVMIAEFEDYAMLREFARAGHGFAPVPSILEEQFRREYGFARVGIATGVKAEFYAISVERKIKNPAVAVMTERARESFLGA
ncbi:MAG TPA: LysR family transcriptional regulator [Steroidobacteraceae bacterium]|nr:LysR family transcriptional regulator [Steroidobacteraceae bacterium]